MCRSSNIFKVSGKHIRNCMTGAFQTWGYEPEWLAGTSVGDIMFQAGTAKELEHEEQLKLSMKDTSRFIFIFFIRSFLWLSFVASAGGLLLEGVGLGWVYNASGGHAKRVRLVWGAAYHTWLILVGFIFETCKVACWSWRLPSFLEDNQHNQRLLLSIVTWRPWICITNPGRAVSGLWWRRRRQENSSAVSSERRPFCKKCFCRFWQFWFSQRHRIWNFFGTSWTRWTPEVQMAEDKTLIPLVKMGVEVSRVHR